MNLEDGTASAFPWAAPRAKTEQLRALSVAAAYLVLGALTLSPLLWVTIPALVDYPNHLARMWVLVHGREIPALASNYVAQWRLLPDLAMDLVVPLFAKIMTVEQAGRLFIALTMLALVGGTAALHRALHGRVGLWPICSLLFVYNAALYWGFLNCLFGIGICLFAFAAWIASRGWNVVPRVALFSVIASVLLFLHLFAFGLYGLAVASYEIGIRLAERRSVLAKFFSLCGVGLQFIPPVGFWLASLAKGGPTFTAYGSLQAKAYALQAPVTFGQLPLPFDQLILFFCIAFLIAAILSRAITLAAAMRLPVVVLLVAAVLMPNWLHGSWAADIRLPVALFFIVIGSIRIDVSRFRMIGLFAVAALVLLGVRVWVVTETWRDDNSRFAEFRAAARAITPGSRLLIVEAPLPKTDRAFAGVPLALAARWQVNFFHMPGLAVIDRSVFMPYLFSGWTSIAPTARNAGLFQSSASPLTPEMLAVNAHRQEPSAPSDAPNILGEFPYWHDWQRKFDFLLWVDFGASLSLPQDATLEPVARGSFFKIYQIVKP